MRESSALLSLCGQTFSQPSVPIAGFELVTYRV
jgi:hypothetical protein